MARQPLEALRTARLLAKHQGFSKLAAQSLLRSLACESLSGARDMDQLRQIWQQFDPAERRDAFIAAHAVRGAVKLGGTDEARGWLRPFWDQLAALGADERASLSGALAEASAGIGPDWLPRLESCCAGIPHRGRGRSCGGQRAGAAPTVGQGATAARTGCRR